MLIALMLALVAVVIAVLVRRWRPVSSDVAADLLMVAPWPSAVVLAPAMPTNFHASPTAFSVVSITQGTRIYNAVCASCHGADGRGEGPLAATLRCWPPAVIDPLLGRYPDGKLFWHIVHGIVDTQGASTMPAFADRLSDADIWAVPDVMKVLAASGDVRAGGWPLSVTLPALPVRCGDAPTQSLVTWRNGQRARVVAVDAASRADIPPEDPRFQTLLITPDGALPPLTRVFEACCVAEDADAWSVFATIAGAASQAFSGTQLLANRNGWLRAHGTPGTTQPDADFLYVSTARGTARSTSGLDALIVRMDAEPVRYVKNGFTH